MIPRPLIMAHNTRLTNSNTLTMQYKLFVMAKNSQVANPQTYKINRRTQHAKRKHIKYEPINSTIVMRVNLRRLLNVQYNFYNISKTI